MKVENLLENKMHETAKKDALTLPDALTMLGSIVSIGLDIYKTVMEYQPKPPVRHK